MPWACTVCTEPMDTCDGPLSKATLAVCRWLNHRPWTRSNRASSTPNLSAAPVLGDTCARVWWAVLRCVAVEWGCR
jgi:hypothetical protein